MAIISSMFMENLSSQSAYFFEFLLGGSHVARRMFRDPRIVVGLMAVWTLLLIAWLCSNGKVGGYNSVAGGRVTSRRAGQGMGGSGSPVVPGGGAPTGDRAV
jgi:hypothetical protein